jgi:hypothetical protein
LGLRRVTSLRVYLTSISPSANGVKPSGGGIRELKIPGLDPTEQLRLPVDATTSLAGAKLARVALTYLFQRQSGDDPYRRNPGSEPWSAFDVRQPGDAEQVMRRVFSLPAARRFSATAWVNPFASTPDDVLDRLAGYRGSVRATSSSRFDGEPRYRASSALDGDPTTAWIADYSPGSPAWLQVSSPRPLDVSSLRLGAPGVPVRRPTQVRVLWPGGATPVLPVRSGGLIRLPHPVRSRSLRLEVVRAVAPPGATPTQRRAVGIADLGGLTRVGIRRRGRFVAPCGTVRVSVGKSPLAMRVTGTMSAFNAGTPLYARSCGVPLALGAGTQELVVAPGPFAVDALRLSSPAPAPVAVAPFSGRVLSSGTVGRGSYDHVRVAVAQSSWLVLGEGYNRGWRATCNGRALGVPTPIDGYANGWAVQPGCQQVSFTFAPNRLAGIGYLVSALGGILCAVLIAVGWWRRRRHPAAVARAVAPAEWDVDRPQPAWGPLAALLAGAAAGVLTGFVFGIVPGVLAVPAVALVLWLRIGPRALTLAATALLGVVVPVLYLVHPGDQSGGNHFGYAMAHLAAHYVGVAAVVALAMALGLTLRAALARPQPRSPRARARGRRSARAARG